MMVRKFITKGRGPGRKVIPMKARSTDLAVARVYKEMDKTFKVGKADASLRIHMILRNGEELVMDIPKAKVARLLADMDSGKGKNHLVYDDDRAIRVADIISVIVDDAETSALARPGE